MSLFGSIFTGPSNGAHRVPQQKAVLKFEHDFEDDPQDFMRWTDLLNSHLQQIGLQRSTIVQGDVPGDGGPRPKYNIFEHFGMITEDMVIADPDRLLVEFKALRLAEAANIAAGNQIGHHLSIARKQERGWISKLISQVVSVNAQAILNTQRHKIQDGRLVKLFYLFKEYASTSNEVIIIAENNLQIEKLRLKDFKFDVRKWTDHIRANLRLIHANGEAMGRQTRILIHEELAKYPNLSFQRIFGKLYDKWQAKDGLGWTMTPTQLLTKADKEFKRCKDRDKCPDDLHLEETSGLKAQVEVFQMKVNELEQKFSNYKSSNPRSGAGNQSSSGWKYIPLRQGEAEVKTSQNGRTFYGCAK